jgi:hypothetical protein
LIVIGAGTPASTDAGGVAPGIAPPVATAGGGALACGALLAAFPCPRAASGAGAACPNDRPEQIPIPSAARIIDPRNILPIADTPPNGDSSNCRKFTETRFSPQTRAISEFSKIAPASPYPWRKEENHPNRRSAAVHPFDRFFTYINARNNAPASSRNCS